MFSFDKNILFEIMKKVKLNEENFPFCELLSDYIKKKIYVDLKTSLKEDDKKYCEKIKIFLGFLKISL